MTRRRQNDIDTRRGSPWDLARMDREARNKIDFHILVPEAAEPASVPQTLADALQAAVDAERDAMLTAAGKLGEIAFQVGEMIEWSAPRCPLYAPRLQHVFDKLIKMSVDLVSDAGGAP